MMQTPTLDIKKRLADIDATYDSTNLLNTFNAMILGTKGCGKTTVCATARRPIIFATFDPGGPKSIRDKISKGGIHIMSYEGESWRKPKEYARWEADYMKLETDGVFEQIGTYVIDSASTWIHAMMNCIVSKQMTERKKDRPNFLPAIGDYNVALYTMIDIIKRISNQPCDFILTAHMVKEVDQLTGGFVMTLKAFPCFQIDMPLLFDETYIMADNGVTDDQGGTINQLLTGKKGIREASTRIGAGGKFDLYEEPNIKNLLKKAGLPFEDKEVE